ncbi:MAG: FliI/YscN family ATPase [Planctomycetota bacterium]|jgi:FliI/YscN family ATPase|nr:FliI/YscN family ATPase [Planctomycetota bacterium]
MSLFADKIAELPHILPGRLTGRVKRVVGLLVEATPLLLPVGSVCVIHARLSKQRITVEIVGFREDASLMMALGEMRGVSPGDLVESAQTAQTVPVGDHLLGRVINGLAQPIDGKGDLAATQTRPLYCDPPDPVSRPRITEPLPIGVRAIDAFMTIGRGQRIGIFAGTGVGKSTLMGMIARFSKAEVAVVSLVGERGREVREFIEKELGEEGMKKSVVVVATSDQPAPVRVRCPFVATAIAEYFRDRGKDVALLMDSVTRMAMSQRDIGSSIGEVPSAGKGYPASVFNLMPRLMERSGISPAGSITGFYTVLVEGDDMNEPIADAARGILDGHIILSRDIAQKNRYPAIDVSASLSRLQSQIVGKEFRAAAGGLRNALAVFAENEDMINIGGYAAGTNPEIDKAIKIMPPLLEFLQQGMDEKADFPKTEKQLVELAAELNRGGGVPPMRPPAPPARRPAPAAARR